MSLSEAFANLSEPAREEEIALLSSAIGGLPGAYLEFLRESDGADGALAQLDGQELRLHSSLGSLENNARYQVQKWLPTLWMIGDDGGDYSDYGFCLDRTGSSDPDRWPVVAVLLGALIADNRGTVASSFDAWREVRFAVRNLDVEDECDMLPPECHLVLESLGPSIASVARIVRRFTDLSPQSVLELIRGERPVIYRCWSSWPERRQLEGLRDELDQVGATTTIHEVPEP